MVSPLSRFVGRASIRTSEVLFRRTLRQREKRPIASFSFDDFPHSAATVGAEILEAHGVCGSFYFAGSLCGRTVEGVPQFEAEDLGRLARAGHEIGCHTFGHVSVRGLRDLELIDETVKNASFLSQCLPNEILSTFSYPFGDMSPLAKRRLARRFAACRCSRPGVNEGPIDLGCLKAVQLYSRLADLTTVSSRIHEAVDRRGWLIFYTHDVSTAPSPYGCTPELLAYAVRQCLATGMEVLPVKNALGAVRFGHG